LERLSSCQSLKVDMLFWGVIRVDSFGNELPRDGVKLLILLDVRYNYERSKKELFVN
jgi:hypothetical protein